MARSTAVRIAVLASGQGSNLQALLDGCASGRIDGAVVGVFSDRPQAKALARARGAGIVATALAPAAFASRDAFDAALFARIATVAPDIVVCAGYLRLLGSPVVDGWRGRMLNIHPSLLPALKGLRTHVRALAAGMSTHGASVHFVTADLDGGPVIAQARVDVAPADSVDALAARVLAREHPLLVATVALVCAGRITLREEVVCLDGHPLRRPLQLAANDAFA
ncbi:MAG TPA: phosphoribosylglycinamide formyltransferase [Luteimonas sp.]|nr:phosphoribosylglycinamide formyltransferase [Luteimonas sp.]